MSIRGIDAQMMVTRTADLLQAANTQQKGGERVQDFLAVQNQALAEHEKASVVKTDKSPAAELHLGNEGGDGSETYTSQQNQELVRDEYMELLDADVGPSEHILDITL